MNRRSFLKVAFGVFAGLALTPGSQSVAVTPAIVAPVAKAAKTAKTPNLVTFDMRNVEEYGQSVSAMHGGKLAEIKQNILQPNYEDTRKALLKRGIVLRNVIYRETGPMDSFRRIHNYYWYALGFNVRQQHLDNIAAIWRSNG